MLKIGKNIGLMRRKKGLTQEQLGNLAGVSAAAVSKWESGTTYPDITLLPVLARSLGVTIDELMSFESDLTDEKIQALRSEIREYFLENGFEEGARRVREIFAEYPNSEKIRIALANYPINQLDTADVDLDEEQLESHMGAMEEVWKSLLESVNPETRNIARMYLAQTMIFKQEYDQAEAWLMELPKAEKLNAEEMMPTIYFLKGELGKSMEQSQIILLQAAQKMMNQLMNMHAIACKEENFEMALLYAKAYEKMEEQYGLVIGNGIDMVTRTYLRMHDYKSALNSFQNMVDTVMSYCQTIPNPFYTHISDQLTGVSQQKKRYKKLLQRIVSNDEIYDPIRKKSSFFKKFMQL